MPIGETSAETGSVKPSSQPKTQSGTNWSKKQKHAQKLKARPVRPRSRSCLPPRVAHQKRQNQTPHKVRRPRTHQVRGKKASRRPHEYGRCCGFAADDNSNRNSKGEATWNEDCASQGRMDNSSVTNVDRRRDDVLVTFSDGHTYAFTHTFLYDSRLGHGQLLPAELKEKKHENNSN